MGICCSTEPTQFTTAKLISHDGKLEEYSYQVKVSNVLQKHQNCFICNSDEMEFDNQVSAIEEDEELQLGQIYFALPLSKLKYPLTSEEMASLAVKASSALMDCSGYSYNLKQVKPVTYTTISERKSASVRLQKITVVVD
ncbi:hypothetical protein C5167_041988 [Papaver somniferum]|uniref:uncharacterized protein LOC113330370 n=1 Tax=Papaver somniferum TaxID=3469 RepID=UPI000E6FD7EE|nr:uncharacterized protein LOC113330370 [Papaver somniferum]RZC87056.1 hypothetical protein C5167_041988 [Papaver somniferum]